MQTLKTDTRKRILAVSRRLFLEKGFQGATTREIAAASGVTLSNLYHYYPSKDELFRVLLKPATDALEGLLAERHGQTGYDIAKIREDGYAAEELEEYMGIIRKHRNSLKMLLFKSQGSSLEGFKEYYVEKATRSVLDWFKLMKAKYTGMDFDVSEFFIHLNNVWMFTLLEEILMHDLPEEETRAVLSDYVRFELIGWKKMMKI
ncbi:MAG: TetR/AcrR family transcriptional regulator [Bacteroidales bacterium]|nr:TetR/AcrR family transcriptional regulator [Bacteroidales bacterium]